MAQEKIPLMKDIEELVQKSIEANKLFISEGSKFITQLATKPGENIKKFQADTFTNTINAYMHLNIQHLKNMVDLGVSLTKEMMNGQTQEEKSNEPAAKEDKPAFVLKANGKPGATISLQFLVDNVKKEAATCNLLHTEYTNQATAVQQNFKTLFTPQSFTLEPGTSQTIAIQINIPRKTIPGIYTSNAQVQGFEPAFFSIHLTITEG
jgi:hypothetical protein